MPTNSDPDDPIETVETAPRRSIPVLRWLGHVTVAAGLIAGLSFLAGEPRRPEVSVSPDRPPVRVTRTARPALSLALTAPRFRLDDPEALEPVRAEPARLHPTTGQREDALVQGGFATIEAPYLRLTLTETPDPEPVQSLFVTLVRRAADGLSLAVIRTGERGSVETKFGAVETLDITLSGEGKRGCTGFASLAPGPLRLDGWLCAPLGQAPEARALSCILDRIALNAQAWPERAEAFAALEARRDPACRPPAAVREIGGETGSIPNRRARKNEAKLRPSAEARP